MKQDYFDRVYEKTYESLLRYAIVHLSDPMDAEDALQNVYTQFYRRIESRGHADILSPLAFLMRILKHEIARSYAQRSANAACELTEDIPADPLSFEDEAETRVMAEHVLDVAKTLPPENYRVFLLYYGFNRSVAEIARELQLGEEAVKSRLFRSRNVVRRQLKQYQSDN